MRKSLFVCAVLWITVELVNCGNIVLQDKQRKNNIVMTDDNIVMKGDFFGGEHCEDTHTVEHVWLPMSHHHQEHWNHWQHGGQESRQLLNYALPERRMSEQQQLSRLILVLANQPPLMQRPPDVRGMPIIQYQSVEKAPQPHNIQQKIEQKIQQRSAVDLASQEERIDLAFEKHLNKVTNEIARD